MATEKEMYELVGRAVVDADFRRKIIADPGKAAEEAGYALTDAQAAALKSADGTGIAEVLEDRFPKSLGMILL